MEYSVKFFIIYLLLQIAFTLGGYFFYYSFIKRIYIKKQKLPFFIGFFPTALLTVGSPTFYVVFLILGVIVFVGAPIIINKSNKPSWKVDSDSKTD